MTNTIELSQQHKLASNSTLCVASRELKRRMCSSFGQKISSPSVGVFSLSSQQQRRSWLNLSVKKNWGKTHIQRRERAFFFSVFCTCKYRSTAMKSEWQHTSELRQSSLSRARESNRGSKMFTVIKRRKKHNNRARRWWWKIAKKKRFKYRYWFLCYFYFQSARASPPSEQLWDFVYFFDYTTDTYRG